MSHIHRPLYAVYSALASGRAPPFDWIVEHASDGTLANVWSNESDLAINVDNDLRLIFIILQDLDPKTRLRTACRAAFAAALPEIPRSRVSVARAAHASLLAEPWSRAPLAQFIAEITSTPHATRAAFRAVAASVPAPSLDEILATP